MHDLVVVCMVTYCLSSAWLYSPGYIQKLRDIWIRFWDERNSIFKYLGICQLCSGFWFGIIASALFLTIDKVTLFSIPIIIIHALIASVFSWTLGAFTSAAMWIKVYFEAKSKEIKGSDSEIFD